MAWIAHYDQDGNAQSVREHSEQTARLSAESAIEPLRDICYLIGLLHDVGKYSPMFQRRLTDKSVTYEHSIAGAKAVEELNSLHIPKPLQHLMQLCIIGHHTGIPDSGLPSDNETSPTLRGRLKRPAGDYAAYKTDLTIPDYPSSAFKDFKSYIQKDCATREEVLEKFAFLVRYCFSCLTDADSIDTAIASGEPARRTMISDFDACSDKLEAYRTRFRAVTPIQKARAELQDQALRNLDSDSEIYLMNMPTGSGKTIAGIRCAFRLAKAHGLQRIIYVIPYNSIIDQTVKTFETIFGDSAQILRHQSSFSYEDDARFSEDEALLARQNAENWDAQIIVTTAVQFFESLYANRRRGLRKVHNMARSVLVFDEAHLLPREYLQPCLRSISFLTKFMHSRALFLTATMPDYQRLIHSFSLQSSSVRELITDRSAFGKFAKCRYYNVGKISDEALIERASASPACLIVVNSKKGARQLYEKCIGTRFHLSTYMIGRHREAAIEKIHQALNRLYLDYPDLTNAPDDRHIIVISTSLIEAGVDLDFADAYRELAGLDSILQTGGRCNREGLRATGSVGVFERADGNPIKRMDQVFTQGIMQDFADISAPDAIEAYYDRYLFSSAVQDEICSKSMKNLCSCEKPMFIKYREYSEKFHLIDDANSRSIIVPCDETSRDLYQFACVTGRADHRRMQPYCCTVSPWEYEQLLQQGVLREIDGASFLTSDQYYNDELGILFQTPDTIL